MKYFSILQEWLEPKFGLVAQSPVNEYDPGDTAQREGMVAVGAEILYRAGKMDAAEYQFIKDRYEYVLNLLNDPNHDGLIRRYPDPAYWGGLSDRLSRDQSVPNVVGMGFMNQARLKKFWDGHTKFSWRWFTTNVRRNWAWPPGHPEYDPKEYAWKLPDITVGSFTASYIRAFKKRDLLSKFRLWFYDLDMLGGSLVKVHFYAKDPTNADDLNHIMNMYQAELESPTLFSKLALWYYMKNRQHSAQIDAFPTPLATNPMQATMNTYFRNWNHGPKLEWYYEDINKYMAETFSWKLKGKFE